MPRRDPLSVPYDAITGPLLRRAEQASPYRRGIRAWVTSPTTEYRHRDRGGRTRHERAFIRSAYFQVRSWQANPDGPAWSLKLTWGADVDRRPSRPGHLARPVTIRVFPRSDARIPANSYLGRRPVPY